MLWSRECHISPGKEFEVLLKALCKIQKNNGVGGDRDEI